MSSEENRVTARGTGDGTAREGTADDGEQVLVLGSEEDWFASALRSMLEPEGYVVVRARSSEETLAEVEGTAPDLVILDEHLPHLEAPELVRLLLDGSLPDHVPLLYHTAGGGTSGMEVRVLEAGAWGVLEEPIRPAHLVAQIGRYLRLGREMLERSRDGQFVDPETDVLTLTGLVRLLPALSNLANRRRTPIAYTAIGPTEPGSGGVVERQRRSMALLCRRHLRQADLVGWLQEGSDFAVVTYGATKEGAGGLARRLNDLVEKQTRASELRYTLSAGILELEPATGGPESRNGGNGRSPAAEMKLESLHALATAQRALRQARDAGGGIRFVDVT